MATLAEKSRCHEGGVQELGRAVPAISMLGFRRLI
jgi:hypothetical protein